MRTLIAIVTVAFCATAWGAATEAEARGKTYRVKPSKQQSYTHYRRPASVGPNGLCQRDTGTPTGNLNFRNRCDVEKFWARTMQRGGGRR